MKNRNLLLCLSSLAMVFLSKYGQAHFLWAVMYPEKHEVAVGLREIPSDDALPLGPKNADVKAWSRLDPSLPLQPQGSLLSANFFGKAAAASLDYGVIDRSEDHRGVFWLKYFAKSATDPVASKMMLKLPVELTLSINGASAPILTVYKNGNPYPGADVVVESGGGKVDFQGKTAQDGTVALPSTTGMIYARALITEPTKGTHNGKSYDLIRTYSTLTVDSGTVKPLSRQLRDSFGNDHDIVSTTAFVKTLMAGRLSKSQLLDHLQQRIYIHEAMDKSLNAHLAAYGSDQKNVLTLLYQDFKVADFPWAKKGGEWTVTSQFVDQINRSRRRSPYYALGVFHVYYGGITHWGRDIGALIDDDLKVHLTYYLNSDGYEGYAKTVDQITDPKDQEDMIRGANDAYAYIIRVNGDSRFK